MTKTKAQKSGSWTPQIQKKAPSLAPPPIVVQRDRVSGETETPMPEYTPLEANALEHHPLMGDISDLPPIQTKLTIGAPGDKYEQEADTVARKVVSQINSPVAQRDMSGDIRSITELPTKTLSRQPLGRNITVSPFAGMVQGKEAIGGGEASSDLESSINSAKGGGQPLDAGLQESMGQAMGADFTGVKVHTDANSDTLNRSLSSRAFTTGQDIFFAQRQYDPGSKGGQELIAHELAHTLQQGAAPVQRQANRQQILPQISRKPIFDIQCKYLEDRKLFYKHTYLGTFYSRGAIEIIDKRLEDYEKTIIIPEKKNPRLAQDTAHIDKKLNKLFQLKDAVEFWVYQHFDLKDATTAKQTRINPTLDLQEEITAAIKQQVQVYNQVKGLDKSSQDLEDELRSDSMDAALKSRVATLIDAVVQPGSLSKFSFDLSLAIDVQPPGYVGFDLGLEVERKEKDALSVRCELAATGGVRVPKIFDIKAKLGGYVEAEAKNSKATMNLISYGLYRKVVESQLMPSGVAAVIWGGGFGTTGQIMADKWAADVERGVFGDQGGEDAYVDLGLLLGIGATVGDTETLGGGVEYKYTTGKKYTKESVESAGGLGKVTKESLGGKTKKGSDTSAHYFTASMNAGPFSGQFDYKKSGESQEIGGEVTFSGIPKFIDFLLNLEGIVTNFKSAYKQKEKSKKTSDTVQGLDNLVSAIQKLSKDTAAVQSIPTTSTEAGFAVSFEKESPTAAWTGSISFNQIAKAPIPSDLGVVSIEAKKSDTRLKFNYEGGSWTKYSES